jgi:hypothetical protein
VKIVKNKCAAGPVKGGDMGTGEIEKIRHAVESQRIFSSHEHFLELGKTPILGVDTLISNSYLDTEWTFATPGHGRTERNKFLDNLKGKSYLVWFKKSLQRIYGNREELTPDNWDAYGERIREARMDPGFVSRVYKEICGYTAVIQDSFWDPGAYPRELGFFHSTFRINSFLYGYRADSADHNGNNARNLYKIDTDDLDEYVAAMERVIKRKMQEGCVALKSALAYDRRIGFDLVDKREAQRILKMKKKPSEEEAAAFGDYIFHQICQIAQRYDIPFQIHTGLGLLWGSDPMNFEPIIREYDGVRFILFHGGFPWYQSIGGLLHNYPNVYADLVWLPLISPSAAISALHQWIEVANSADRIAWGSDCRTPEESYGAVLALKYVLLSVFTEKVQGGYIDIDTARSFVKQIAHDNARKIYLGTVEEEVES